MSLIDRAAGRTLFGADPAGYDRARPDYPAWVFDFLRDSCGLAAGARVLDIGAGTGKVTRALLAHGADPVVAVEPDGRLAAFMRATFAGGPVTVIAEPFETAELGSRAFDLVASGTAFHWLDEDPALAKIAQALRPGGWWAALWNVFGDPERADPFHQATKVLLQEGPPSPSQGAEEFAMDEEARFAALDRTGAFEAYEHKVSRWELILDPDQVAALYATYSNITVRDDREQVLEGLRRIAAAQFPGGVTRNMITSLFVARRR